VFVVEEMFLLIFVAAETGASEPLPSKMTSASAAIPAFGQCLPNRYLANGHIPSQYFFLYYSVETGRGVHSVSYPNDTEGKVAGASNRPLTSI
jgi:hypothetical protein